MEKKIIFLLPCMTAGGAERVVSILSKELAERGYEVILALIDKEKRAYSISEKVKINQIGPKLNCGSLFRKIVILLKLHFLFRKEKGAIVIPFQYSCLKYASFARKNCLIKVIACERNDPEIMHKDNANESKKLFEAADYAIFQTSDARKFYFPDSYSNWRVILNPIVLYDSKWKPDIQRKRIITVCRLTKQKNLYMALDAMSILAQRLNQVFTFDIYGEGELFGELMNYTDKLGISSCVNFCGVTGEVYEKLLQSSVFVLSSDYEGMSNSMLEALSIGMPVVCTDCPAGGAREVISNYKNGLLTPVGNAEALADAIQNVLTNEKLAKQLGDNAYLIRNRLNAKRVVDEWENVFEMLSE